MKNNQINSSSIYKQIIDVTSFYAKNNSPIIVIYFLSLLFYELLAGNSFFVEPRIVVKEVIFDWKFYVAFFSLLFLSSLFMIYLLTKLKSRSARIIYGLIMGLSTLFLLLDIAMFSIESTRISEFLAAILIWIDILLLLSVIYGVIVFVQGKTKILSRNFLVIMASVSLGRTVSLFFDIETLVIALVFFAVYDAFSVFLGPLRKVLGKPQKIPAKSVSISMSNEYLEHYTLKICEKGIPVFITKTRIVIGVGDLLFFSIIISKILLSNGFVLATVVLIALLIGHSMTLFLVKRISPFPGLPLPIFTVLLTMKITNII